MVSSMRRTKTGRDTAMNIGQRVTIKKTALKWQDGADTTWHRTGTITGITEHGGIVVRLNDGTEAVIHREGLAKRPANVD